MAWHRGSWRSGSALPLAVLLVGLCLTAAVTLWLREQTERQAQRDFQRSVERVAEDVQRRMRQPIYGLTGAGGVYAANGRLERAAFAAYVESRDLAREFPGVRGFGFIERVERTGLESFLARTRADGVPQFTLRQLQDTAQSDLYVIKYIESAVRNLGALGLDVGSEPRRREAAESAVATGEATLTRPITLVQDNGHQKGFLLFVPLYRQGTDPATPAQRRAALVGLLYAPIVAAEMLDDVSEVQAGLVDFTLSEGHGNTLEKAVPAQAVFDSLAYTTVLAGRAAVPARSARFEATRALKLPGLELALQVRSTPLFEAAVPQGPVLVRLIMGVLVSLLLAGFVRQQQTGRRRAEALAQGMTAELGRLALVAERTSNAVIITDRHLRITWVNEAFTRLYGHTAEQALGQTPGALLGSPASTLEALQTLHDAALAGTGCRVEVVNRTRYGREIFIDTEVQPTFDAQGRLTGFIEVASDITASKRVAQELARQQQRLSNIIEGTQAGTWEWNVESGETLVSERWAQIIGHTVASLGPAVIETWRQLGHPEDIRRSGVLLQDHFDSLTDGYECEARIRHRDGHWVWVLDRGQLFSRSEDGRPRWMAGTRIDISHRKAAEAALHASQALLAQTGRIAGIGGWEFDIATSIVRWTEQTRLIHEAEPGHQPTLETAIQYYAPEARPVIEQAVRQSLATGQGYDLELPFITAKGRPIWVRAVGEPEFVDGAPVRLVGALQDITARRQMEEELRRRNEVMQTVLDNLPCGLSVFDGDLKLLASNREFRRLLDFPDTLFDAAPLRFEDVIRFNAARGEYGSDDLEARVQGIIERARAPAVLHQFERVRPDGTQLEVRGAPMPRGGFVTTYTDISARKRAEAEVARSAALLRGAIDAIDEAFVLFDRDERLLFCNDKYRQIYPGMAHLMVPGATFEEIIRPGAEAGQYLDAVGRADAWVAERLAAHRSGNTTLVQKLDTGRTLRIVERKRPDGHIVGFRIDITELVQATEAAQKASLAKSQFLANMSHEIRKPMNAILGMLALLRKTELTPRQADYAGKTDGAARSLLGLLNDILDFSKVEAGKMALDLHPFRIDQLLRDLSVIVAANTGAKPVEVLFDIDPALPRALVGDAMRLQQVLINLSGNAVKFTSQGEVVLSVAVRARDEDQVTLEFAVRDTGIGIAPENQARIFSGFTQAEASTTRRFGGTGLGVAISQRLVGLMGGELQVDSEPGRGSRFHFTVTLQVADAAALAGEEGTPPAPAAVALRALVEDDNPSAREVLCRMGQSLGWTIDTAASGEDALPLLQARAAAGQAYQAVFVDWQMPGLDGWATSQRIRELGLGSALPVVVMVTAHGREMLAQRSPAEQAMLDGFLVKPVTASMLFDAIADAGLAGTAPRPARVAGVPGAQRLAGMRLLVVEDNLNNQQVARELLEDEGASVQIANNGQEAVEAVAAAAPAFDVVLMDLQMPVMDGFTATARIRQDLGQGHLPIVAMTANALASDREACLAAGMNEHIGKPFDLDHLVRVLCVQSGRAVGAASLVAGAAAGSVAGIGAAVRAAAQAAGVQIEPAIARMGGKAALYRQMLRGFIDDLARLPAELQASLTQGDAVAAARLLHTVKGVAATLGATDLAAAAGQAEKALAAATAAPGAREEEAATATAAAAAGAAAALQQARPAFMALCQALQPDAEAPDPGPGAGFDPAALRQGLAQLAELLRNSDMGAMDAVAGLPRPAAGPLDKRFRALDDAIAGLDFEPALRHCDELIETLAP